jgi:methyl-accepting chemotaxis protein
MQRATQSSIAAITGIGHTIREIGNISSAIAADVTEQGAATQEIARGVELRRVARWATAKEVNLMGAATHDTRSSAAAVKMVADDLSSVASRIRKSISSSIA